MCLNFIIVYLYFCKVFKVVIIGTGNIAFHFSKVILEKNNLKLCQIIGRQKNIDQELEEKVDYEKNIKKIKSADLYLICVSDNAIQSVSNKIKKNSSSIVAHCSGSTDIEILSNHENYGVIYPLQTFSKNREIKFSDLPILIESNNKKTLKKLDFFCKSLTKKIIYCKSNQRVFVHISAIFTNNFGNYLNVVSQKILKSNKLDTKIILPLVKETADKLFDLDAKDSQTGPAIRNDDKTIKKHLHLLKNSEFFELYEILSKSILKNRNEL